MRTTAFITLIIYTFFLSNSFCIAQSKEVEHHASEVMSLYKTYQKKFPLVTEISAVKAISLASTDNVIFIDVRSKKEQLVSMIPGAISHTTFAKNAEDHRGNIIVAYCTIGYRSGKFAQKYRDQGFHTMNLAGGILQWIHNGGTINKNNEPTRNVHVYGKKWNLVPKGYHAIW